MEATPDIGQLRNDEAKGEREINTGRQESRKEDDRDVAKGWQPLRYSDDPNMSKKRDENDKSRKKPDRAKKKSVRSATCTRDVSQPNGKQRDENSE